MNTTFTFDSTHYDPLSGVAEFRYVLGDHTFTETLELSPGATIPEPMLFALHLALGVSYWKAFCPREIVIKSGVLTRAQADFWNTLYTKGLGEFFYVNQIDFRGLVNFPYVDGAAAEPIAVKTSESALVPIGGGKDSLVTLELLRKSDMPFSTFTLGTYDVIEAQRTHIDAQHHTITRTLDPKLFELNDQGAYNGHVPISSIYAFTAVLQAMITGLRYVVLSNERSASYGNVEYLGEQINHQWSKSFEFEKMINDYVHDYITPDVTYFSVLRPLYEIAIAREFAQHAEWLPRFTSCNRNFAIREKAGKHWCGECPKCAFVFAILAPFVEHDRLVNAFGKNLFADAALMPLYQELLGVKDIKPFDCVGTPDEVAVALAMAHETGDYEDTAIMQMFVQEVLPTVDVQSLREEAFSVGDDHALPPEFQNLLP